MTIQAIEATPDQARQLTDRIRIAVEGTWQLIVEAYQSRAWSALGYKSWDDYCTREFGTSRLKLPREDRADQVASLRESGLSLRAISSATGLAVNTIRKDVSEVYQNDTPEPERAEYVNTSTGELTDEPGTVTKLTGTNSATDSPKITGMDGKEYSRPEPLEHKPRPEAITSQFTGVVTELNRVLDKFYRISENKNFPNNKNQIATLHGSDLARAISELQTLADALN